MVYLMLFGLPAQIVMAATPIVGSYDPSDTAISQTANTTTVNLLAEQAIINWKNFNTIDGELLEFLRNNGLSSFAVLNRVSGGATQFNGDLEAIKGTVFILNPNGITFGPSAYLQARNLVATSMKMSDNDFLAATAGGTISGDMEFTNPYTYEGARLVANYGEITNVDSVYLVGKNVLNAGTITANEGGLVAMVAGDEMVLGKPGSDVVVKKLVVNHVENHTVDNGAIGGTASNLNSQFGINASGNTGSVSAPGGDLVLAAGDIWSNAIENVQDLSATAHGDIHFEEAINITGDMRAEAGLPTVYDSEWVVTDYDLFNTYKEEQPVEIKRGGDIHAKDTITAGGNIDMIANGVQLDAAVEATTGDLKIAGRQSEDPVDGYHDVETAALTAGGDIEISTTGIDREWSMDGTYTESFLFHTIHWDYGSWKEMTPLPGTITLNDNVVAGGNLTLFNNTNVTGPAILQAGVDIILENGEAFYQNCDTLTGTEKLTLDAKTGQIDQGTATISVTGSELIMRQAPTLDVAGRSFLLQDTTHLTLESYNGSVFATDTADGGNDDNAADQWASIGAKANGGVILSGHEKDIKARRLEAAHGPIEVDAKTNDILANDHGFTGDDGILASGGGNITLTGNNVKVIGDIEAEHGSGIRPVGYNSDLTIEADDDIGIDGYADIDGDMVLRANISSGDGDVVATGNLIAGGSIDIYSSDSTTYLGGDRIEATDDITLHNDTVLNGGALQKVKALTGQLYTNGSVHKTTTGDLEMFGGYNGPLYPDMDYSVKTQDVTVDDGELSIAGNATVRLDGSIYSSGDMTLASNVDGIASTLSQAAPTSTPVSYDYLVHYGDVIQTLNGDVDLSAQGSFIALDGGVNPTDAYISAGGDILLRDYTWVQYNRKLQAGDDVVLAAGKRLQGQSSLNIVAGDDIIIGSTDVDNHWLAPEDDTGTPSEVRTNGDMILNAGDDVYVHGELNTLDGSGGDIEITALDDTIHLYGNVTADQTDGGDIILHTNTEVVDGVTLDAGHNVEAFGTLYGHGSLTVLADTNIKLKGHTETVGEMMLDAGDSIKADRSLTSGDKLTALADWNIELGGHVESTSDMMLDAGNNITAVKSLTSGGKLTALADWNIDLDGVVSSTSDMMMDAGNNIKSRKWLNSGGKLTALADWNIELDGDLISTDDMMLDAENKIVVGNKITSGGKLTALAGNKIIFNRWAKSEGDMLLDAGNDVYAYGDLTSNAGSIDIYSSDDTTYLGADVTAADNVTLHNNTKLIREYGDQTIEAQDGTLTAKGWVWKTTEGNMYLLGNNDDPEHNNGKAIDLQYDGCLPAASTSLGNLEIYAENGDIQISGDLTTFGLYCDEPEEEVSGDIQEPLDGWYDRPTGGVSVIADNGKIYTEGASPDNSVLNIGIVGNSDDVTHRMYYDNGVAYEDYYLRNGGALGVDLPYGEGKAAIVVMSNEDLNFGPDTMLIAHGTYDSSVVDDRVAVGFMHEPTTIDGIPRNEGDPIDVAVYVASTGTDTSAGQGDVHLDGRAIDVAENGTMVVDAYDTVTFGDFDTFNLESFEGCEDLGCFLIKLALRFHDDIDFEDLCEAFGTFYDEYEGDDFLQDFLNDYFEEGFFFNIDRLEVVSRITEWLYQASNNGTLPYPYNPEIVEALIGGDYILRGAGLGNLGITDGRAWVLEDPVPPAPLYEEAGEDSDEEGFGEGGCPALMDWLAAEIGVPAEDIQVVVAGAFALSTDIQPCEMCAKLKDASNILEDVEGTQIAALARVANEFVTTPAPPSPEQMTSIATALAAHVDDGTHYAAAGEWIDALVAYIGIMNTEMGYSAGDAAAFAEKYVTRVNESGNEALVAYVQARIAALGG
jgi:filamentous hemagglutinin family protein